MRVSGGVSEGALKSVLAIVLALTILVGCGQTGETVVINLPAGLAGDVAHFDEKEYVKVNEGVTKAKQNDDGSLQVTMTKERQSEMIEEIRTEMETTFASLIESFETPYIKNVEHSNNYRNVKISVDKGLFEISQDLTPFLVAVSVGKYQAYSGDDFEITVTVHDVDTDEELGKVQLPN